MIRNKTVLVGLLAVIVFLLGLPQVTEAQEPEIAYACYVPDVGAVYRIDPDGPNPGPLPTTCFEGDQEFSWILGEAPPTALPIGCAPGEIPRYAGSTPGWECAAANDHTHSQYSLESHIHPASDVAGALHGVEFVSETHNIPGGGPAAFTMTCPSGKIAISSGWQSSLDLVYQIPNPSDQHSWDFVFETNPFSSTVPVYTHLVCVSRTLIYIPTSGG